MLTIKRLLGGLPVLVLPVFAIAYLNGKEAPARIPRSPSPSVRIVVDPVPGSGHIDFQAARRVTNTDVIARVMSFDSNHDGKVGRDELLERMQWLLDEADRNEDGVLTRNEILAKIPPPIASGAVRGFRGDAYGFDDESEDTSNAHIDGVLADLKLPTNTFFQARTTVHRFLDKRNEGVSGNRLEPRSARASFAVLRVDAQVFEADQAHRRAMALAAARRDPHRSRLSDAERTWLVEGLSGILTAVQRADFAAALARRPIKKLGARPPAAFRLLHATDAVR